MTSDTAAIRDNERCNVARTIIVLQTTQTSKDSYVFTSRIVKKQPQDKYLVPIVA